MLRGFAKAGLDPLMERDRERRGIPTFKMASEAAHEALSPGWSEKGAKTFIGSLANHAFPKIGSTRVDLITAADISQVLAPIWMSKPDMARKVRQRIGTVLNYAHGKGWRASEAPSKAVIVGLPRQPKGGNYSAMPYGELQAFASKLLAKLDTNGRRALWFQILTAARPGEVRRARWSQIDFEKREWNRPAEIMKGVNAEAHTVTLNEPAVELLKELNAGRDLKDELIFSGQRGALMSDMTLNKVLRTEGIDHDAHGFRSSFRDWAAERMPELPDAVAEAALAHTVPDKVVRAYKRTNFIEMRRTLLDAWGSYLTGAS